MIVAITDGRANISLKRSNDPEAAAASDAPKPTSQELKVQLSFVIRHVKRHPNEMNNFLSNQGNENLNI